MDVYFTGVLLSLLTVLFVLMLYLWKRGGKEIEHRQSQKTVVSTYWLRQIVDDVKKLGSPVSVSGDTLDMLLGQMESAAQIIRNIYAVRDNPEDEGIHPNDFRAAVDEWLEKYDG